MARATRSLILVCTKDKRWLSKRGITALKQNLIPIQTLTGILPLLGLLGTVTGIISIFEVLNVFGTGNARGMAEGISRALLPTTAGLATSIVGVYFSADLNKRAATREMMAKDALTTEKSTNKIQDLLTQ